LDDIKVDIEISEIHVTIDVDYASPASTSGAVTVNYSPNPTSGAATETLESGDTIIPVTVQKGLKDSAGTDIVAEATVLKKLGESEDTRQVAPDGVAPYALWDSDGPSVNPVLGTGIIGGVLSGGASVQENILAPDSLVNIQTKDSAGDNIGAVIPITARSGETKAQDITAPNSILMLNGIEVAQSKSNETFDITPYLETVLMPINRTFPPSGALTMDVLNIESPVFTLTADLDLSITGSKLAGSEWTVKFNNSAAKSLGAIGTGVVVFGSLPLHGQFPVLFKYHQPDDQLWAIFPSSDLVLINPPTGFTRTQGTGIQIDLAWTQASVANSTEIQYKKTSSSTWLPLASTAPAVSTYSDLYPPINTSVDYRIREVNGTNKSEWVTTTPITTIDIIVTSDNFNVAVPPSQFDTAKLVVTNSAWVTYSVAAERCVISVSGTQGSSGSVANSSVYYNNSSTGPFSQVQGIIRVPDLTNYAGVIFGIYKDASNFAYLFNNPSAGGGSGDGWRFSCTVGGVSKHNADIPDPYGFSNGASPYNRVMIRVNHSTGNIDVYTEQEGTTTWSIPRVTVASTGFPTTGARPVISGSNFRNGGLAKSLTVDEMYLFNRAYNKAIIA
jgi:hypothetical protein